MKRIYGLLLAVLALAAWSERAPAAVKMPAVFGSNMVLQREIKVPVWGTAAPGEKITVRFADQTVKVTAGSDGLWQAALAPMKASGQPRKLSVEGTNALDFDNVLVGEVWVCSGQSNMEMGIGACNVPNEIAKAKEPLIRLFMVPKATALQPQSDLINKTTWKVCTPATIMEGGWNGFSAAAYFFGRELQRKLGVPVGLIGTYWGGTPAQAWTSQEKLAAKPELKDFYMKRWDEKVARFPEEKAQFPAKMAAWEKEAAKAKAEGKPAPWQPRLDDPETSPNGPAHLYNAMIAPLIPFGIKGAIWYQGESNAGPVDAELYQKLFATMIRDWRARWGEGDFPFLFVQLANFMDRVDQPSESSWALLRESQLKTLALPKTGMAVIIDIGEAKDIHPKDKLNVGRRLALAGLKVAYGQRLVYSGPVFDKMRVADGKAVLSFKSLGGGLVSKTGENIKGFAVAGADKKFVWANAKIKGKQVVVSSPQVKNPVAVRYAWANNPEAGLFNKAGLPATPFRTDNWPFQG